MQIRPVAAGFSIAALLLILSALVVLTLASPTERASSAISSAPGDVSSLRSGNWSDPTLWSSGLVPRPVDKALISAGHTVVFDTSAVVNGVDVNGTLDFSRTVNTVLETTGNIIVNFGGQLLIGLPENPIPANITARIVFDVDTNADWVGGFNFEPADTGLWVLSGGRWESHGAPIYIPWTDLAANAATGSTQVVAEGNLSDWPVGATVLLTATGRNISTAYNTNDYFTEDEVRGIVAVQAQGNGTSIITLDAPLAFEHSGTASAKGEIALLTRNVTISSKGFARAHTMYMHGSSGAPGHTLFQNLGPDVDNRKPIHFFSMAETSIGKLVRGNVVWDSVSGFMTIHNSLGIEVSDNIGFRTIGTGFMLQDSASGIIGPKPMDNVFIHNLAVKATSTDRHGRRHAGFYSQRENHFIGNTAVSIGGNGDSAGFHWPEAHIQSGGQTFLLNEAHSNLIHGMFGWQNTGYYHIVDATMWRNGGSGVKWGAYRNQVEFHGLESFGNAHSNFRTRNNRPTIHDSHLYGEPAFPSAIGLFIDFYTLPPQPDNPGRTYRSVFENHTLYDIDHTSKATCAVDSDCIPTFNAIVDTQLLSANPIRFGSDWERTDSFYDVRDWRGVGDGLPSSFRMTRPDQPKPSPSAFYYAPFDAWIDPTVPEAAARPVMPTISWSSTPASIGAGPVTFEASASGFTGDVKDIEFFVDENEQGSPWIGEYFSNPLLAGDPVVVTEKTELSLVLGREPENRDLKISSTQNLPPYLTLTPKQAWSARFTRSFTVNNGGQFRFQYSANDGIRLYIDGAIAVDKWKEQSACCSNKGSHDVTLSAGPHEVVVEFFQTSYDGGRLAVLMNRVIPGNSLVDSFTFNPADWENRRQIHVYARTYDQATDLYAYAPTLTYDNPFYNINEPQVGYTPPAPTVPEDYRVAVSTRADRSAPVPLDGAVVAGNIYAFETPESADIISVDFYLDNPTMAGGPLRTESSPPFDLAGGSFAIANPFDTSGLADGPHTLTVRISRVSSPAIVVHANFVVSNLSPTPVPSATSVVQATPTPIPTPTPTAVPQGTVPELLVSQAPSRSGAIILQNASVSGDLYVYVGNDADLVTVVFFLDDPEQVGESVRVEMIAPYDFAGGSTTVARPFNSTLLTDGVHEISAVLETITGDIEVITSTFTVNNSGSVPPPTSTPVPQPTATPTPAPQPTATPIPVPQPTATPQPAGVFDLLVSASGQRTPASNLDGASLSGNIFVFAGNESAINSVTFYLDDPNRTGALYQFEQIAPFDFAGGEADAADPFDTRTLSNGVHQITAVISRASGGSIVVTASFTVNNSGSPAPTETPVPQATATPAPQPTATPAPVVNAPPPPPTGGGGGGAPPPPQPTPVPSGPVAPGAPRSVSASAEGLNIVIRISPPLVTGGSPVTGYRVLSAPDARIYFIDRRVSGDTLTLSGLKIGVDYQFQVRAINSAGLSASGTMSNTVTIKQAVVDPTPTPVLSGAPPDAPVELVPTVVQTPEMASSPVPAPTPAATQTPAPVQQAPKPTATPVPTIGPAFEPTPTPVVVPDVATTDLKPGWNLVSFSVLPEDTSIESVFASIAGLYSEVSTIKNGEAVTYVSGRESNTLTSITPDRGYWVKMNANATLALVGVHVDRHTRIELVAGWNLVPYLIDEPWPVRLALSSIDGLYDEVRGFDSVALSYFPALPTEFNTLTRLAPEMGYLIHMTAPAELVYP